MIRTSCNIGAVRANGTPEQVAERPTTGSIWAWPSRSRHALDFASLQPDRETRRRGFREGKLTPPIFFYANSLAPAERDAFSPVFAEQSFTDEDVRTSLIPSALRL